MPRYDYECPSHGRFEVIRKMMEVQSDEPCLICGRRSNRVFTPIPDVWHTEGSHRGDYGTGNTVGTKADALNKNWSKAWGEAPPPPAADVPTNGSEKY